MSLLPGDMSPPEYFRLCISPLPFVRTDSKLKGIPLFVRAVEPYAFGLPSGELLRRVLCDEGGRSLFSRDPGEILPLAALERLSNELSPFILALNPSPFLAAYKGLREALKEGAEHWTNKLTALSLGESFEVTPSGRILNRPERFFGGSASSLLSCHLAAFEVCRSLIFDAWNKPE